MNFLMGFICFFATFISSLYADVVIVSDIDDTIRQSNTRHVYEMAKVHITNGPAFNHLIQIYRDMIFYYEKQGETVHLLYLTAAPSVLNVKSWLEKYEVPKGEIQQKPISYIFSGTYKYKLDYLTKYLLKIGKVKGPLTVWMFGDNSEVDDLVYQSILVRQPIELKEVHSFIRRVWPGTYLLPELHYFISENDLLQYGTIRSLIQEPTVLNIIKADQEDTLIPKYIKKEFEMNSHSIPNIKNYYNNIYPLDNF